MSVHMSERLRVPQPLLRTRIGTGRGAMEQPNATGDGDVPLTVRFWIALAGTGVLAGLAGMALMRLLDVIAHLAYGPGEFGAAVAAASPVGRVVPLLAAGLIGGVGWFLLRRLVPGRSDVDDCVWTGDGRLGVVRSTGTSVLSVTVVGLGASLGREAAPKLMGGVAGSLLGGWARLTVPQRRLLVACGAGAGFAAVYDVPLGGALFTAEVLLGAVRLPVVLPALACSSVATLVARIGLPQGPTYPGVADLPFHPAEVGWALVAGPLIGLVAVGFVRLIAFVSRHQPRGWWALPAPLGAFAVLAALGLVFPQLYGNGQDIAQQAFTGSTPFVLLAALCVLKPLVTALCLGSGATGGLVTPTLATGAALGAALGVGWSLLWPGAPAGAYAMIGAAAMLGAAMQAPLAGAALVLELTHGGFALMVPLVLATALATAVSRWIDGYSIYSARLGPSTPPASNGTGVGSAPGT